jgi:hypothetical protein
VRLGRVEVFVGSFKIGTGVDHPLVEPESVKFVRHIVMKSHCLPVARDRVKCAVELGGLSPIPQMAASGGHAEQVPAKSQYCGGGPAATQQVMTHRHRCFKVSLDVKIITFYTPGNFPFIVILTRSPFGSGKRSMSIVKSIALMMPRAKLLLD